MLVLVVESSHFPLQPTGSHCFCLKPVDSGAHNLVSRLVFCVFGNTKVSSVPSWCLITFSWVSLICWHFRRTVPYSKSPRMKLNEYNECSYQHLHAKENQSLRMKWEQTQHARWFSPDITFMSPTLIIGRADIEGSKRNVVIEAFLNHPLGMDINITAWKQYHRFRGVVGYHTCLTHRRSPVRSRTKPFGASVMPRLFFGPSIVRPRFTHFASSASTFFYRFIHIDQRSQRE